MNKEIGIKEIAELAGVSIGTVDRVIHGRPGVSEKTAALIHTVIKKTGYKKNNAASRLKLARSKTIRIAVILPFESKVQDNYWNLPFSGIHRAVEELKDYGITYTLLTFKMSEEKTFLEQTRFLFENNYDALITVPYFYSHCQELLKKAAERKIKVVFIDTFQEFGEPHYAIHQDSLKSGAVAARLLNGVVGDQGNYLVVNIMNNVYTPQNNLEKREAGFRSFFDTRAVANSNIHKVASTAKNLVKVRHKLIQILEMSEKVGIFVTNSRAYLLPEILKEIDTNRVTIIGYDLNEKNKTLLEEEKIHFLLNQQPEWQGYNAAKGIFKVLTEGDSSALELDIPIEIFVKENL